MALVYVNFTIHQARSGLSLAIAIPIILVSMPMLEEPSGKQRGLLLLWAVQALSTTWLTDKTSIAGG